jgi:integrase
MKRRIATPVGTAERDEIMKRIRAGDERARLRLGEPSLAPLPHFGDHLTPAVLLTMNTGLRRGELFKLRWASVDFNRRLITVEGRNAKSRQTACAVERRGYGCVAHWREQSGGKRQVFEIATGFKTAWAKLLKRARITEFRWHDLRHHFASRLVQRACH